MLPRPRVKKSVISDSKRPAESLVDDFEDGRMDSGESPQ